MTSLRAGHIEINKVNEMNGINEIYEIYKINCQYGIIEVGIYDISKKIST